MVEHDIFIEKCKNCGFFFIPRRRSDAEYCDRVFGDTCLAGVLSFDEFVAWLEQGRIRKSRSKPSEADKPISEVDHPEDEILADIMQVRYGEQKA